MSIAGESKRRRPLGPLDDYCDELEEALATERAAHEQDVRTMHAELAREAAAHAETRKEADAHHSALEDAVIELARVKEELERSRYKGCGSYPRAIGEIESRLGIVGNPPLGEVVEAVRKLVTDLATERAAREQAEAQFEACRKDREAAVGRKGRLQQAERERDTALAREKTAERLLGEERLAKVAAETALASARATIGRVAEYVGYLEQDIAAARKNREPQTGMHVPYHGAFCSAPISTIKDLERFARSMRDLLTSHPAPVAADANCDEVWASTPQSQGAMGPAAVPTGRTPVLRPEFVALGKALGMGRPSCKNGHAWVLGTCGRCGEPKPVAAPSLLAAASKVTQLWADLSSQELYGEALDELLQDDRQELEDAMQALRDAKSAPVAAPCAGCAAVRAIVEPVSVEHGHRTEDTSLVLSELADKVLEALR